MENDRSDNENNSHNRGWIEDILPQEYFGQITPHCTIRSHLKQTNLTLSDSLQKAGGDGSKIFDLWWKKLQELRQMT